MQREGIVTSATTWCASSSGMSETSPTTLGNAVRKAEEVAVCSPAVFFSWPALGSSPIFLASAATPGAGPPIQHVITGELQGCSAVLPRRSVLKIRLHYPEPTSHERERMAIRKAAQNGQSQAPAKQTAISAPRPSRGPVDAPGKRHRKPPPQEPIRKRMGEPRGKQMGQKSVKAGWRSGRG
jgi:hypothetical protein